MHNGTDKNFTCVCIVTIKQRTLSLHLRGQKQNLKCFSKIVHCSFQKNDCTFVLWSLISLTIGKKLENLPLQTSSLGVQEELEFDASDYQEILPVLKMLRHRVIDGPSSKLPPQVLVTMLKDTNEKNIHENLNKSK